MGKVIKLTLDAQSINHGIRQIEAYKRDLRSKISRLLGVIVDEGAELARAKVIQMDAVMFGDLANSIGGIYDPATHIGVIFAGAPHAVFVEFGTGVVGAGNPHPDPVGGWKYDINSHGEAGWWYWSDSDNNWHWTKGMPSRPFMWETAKELPFIMEKAAKAVFG